MGVRGLSSFLTEQAEKGSSEGFEAHRLRNCQVLFDGNNLCHALYAHYCLPYEFGGEYDLFRRGVHKFVWLLRRCALRPIILFDGCSPSDGSKLATQLSRVADRLRCSPTAPGRLLPIFAPTLFAQCLHECNVPFLTCPFEADRDLAEMASILQCPVVSNDSDFFIFPLSAGFIPLDSLCFGLEKENCECCAAGYHYYVPCKRYLCAKLRLAKVGYVRMEFLPLVAALCGNDFFKGPTLLENFFTNQLHLSPIVSNRKVAQRKFQTLLSWCAQFSSTKAAIDCVMQSVPSDRRLMVRKRLEIALEQYSLTGDSWALPFFNTEKNCFMSSGLDKNSPSKLSSILVPCLHAFRDSRLLPSVMNAVVNGYAILPCAIEDKRRESVFNDALPLRKLLYRLCLPPCASGNFQITEYTRKGYRLEKIIFQIKPLSDTVLELPEWRGRAIQELDELMPATLDLQVNCDKTICLQWLRRLLHLWVLTCSPSTILLMTMCTLIVAERFFESNSCTVSLDEQSEEQNVEMTVSEGESYACWRSFSKYLQLPSVNRAKPFDLMTVHQYSIFQVLYLYLYQMLDLMKDRKKYFDAILAPLPPGRLVYNLVADLSKRKANPMLCVADLLGGRRSPAFITFTNVFEDLLLVKNSSTLNLNIDVAQEVTRKRCKRRTRKTAVNGITRRLHLVNLLALHGHDVDEDVAAVECPSST